MPDISKKRSRERLPKLTDGGKLRQEPYWQRLAKGQYLGYRVTSRAWVARYGEKSTEKNEKGQQHYKALNGIGPDDYDGALEAAQGWFEQLTASPGRVIKRSTVRVALEAYVADLRHRGRDATATEAEGRFKRTVWDDPLGNLPLEAATPADFEAWQRRLKKGRQPRSVNRAVRAVAAGLTRAVKLGHVGNPSAWKLEALPDDVEDEGETAVFLDSAQRKAIVAAATPRAAAFLRGLELTGARPKELAAVTAGDFDGQTVRLAHRKGRPARLRVRSTVLGPDGVEFFASLAKDKPAAALLFTEDGTQSWRRHVWARGVRAAIDAVNVEAKGAAHIPAGASAYSFRHARISELLRVHRVDPLTTAQQTGTSLAMIEKAYHRLIPAALHEKLALVKSS